MRRASIAADCFGAMRARTVSPEMKKQTGRHTFHQGARPAIGGLPRHPLDQGTIAAPLLAHGTVATMEWIVHPVWHGGRREPSRE